MTKPCRGRSHNSDGGFTIVEALIALALVLLGLVLAVQLLLESRQLFLDAERRAVDPAITVAVAQLRTDVAGASSVFSPSPGWTDGPLVLAGTGVGTVLYARRGEDLVRARLAADGTELGSRTLIRPLSAWRWRSTTPELVDLEIGYRIHDPVPELRTTPEAPELEARSLSLRVALRGAARSGRW